MYAIGAILLSIALFNALFLAYTPWGSGWLHKWSPLFIFLAVTLLCAYISDHKVAVVIASVCTVGWWYFMVGW